MSAARTRVTSARGESSSSTTTRTLLHRGRREGNLSMVNMDTQPLADKSLYLGGGNSGKLFRFFDN